MTTTITITIAVTITITINIRKTPEFGVHAQESYKHNMFYIKNMYGYYCYEDYYYDDHYCYYYYYYYD